MAGRAVRKTGGGRAERKKGGTGANVHFSVTLDRAVVAEIDVIARQTGRTRSGIMGEAARVWLDRDRKARVIADALSADALSTVA